MLVATPVRAATSTLAASLRELDALFAERHTLARHEADSPAARRELGTMRDRLRASAAQAAAGIDALAGAVPAGLDAHVAETRHGVAAIERTADLVTAVLERPVSTAVPLQPVAGAYASLERLTAALRASAR